MQITPSGGLWRGLRKFSDLGLPMMKRIPALCGLLLVCVTAAPCVADVSGMYPRAELEKSAPRLSTALTKIYEAGREALTSRPRLSDFEFGFPLPSSSDEVLNFYAYDTGGKPIVVMPILSLKVVEDMATAYAPCGSHQGAE